MSSGRRNLALGLATAAISAMLCVLVLATLVAGYVASCRATGQNVDRRLARLPLVRWVFGREDYAHLVRAIQQGRSEGFSTTWDFDTPALLGREQFEAVEMFGQPRFRRLPGIRVDDFAVWTGLEIANYIAVESPAVTRALDRCRVVRRIAFETDALGFKKAEFPLEPGGRSVLFLGDSFTEGMHVRSEDTFASLFGRRMRQAGLAGVPVNGGVAGYGTLEAAWTAENYTRRVGAAVVVENLYLNDVSGDPWRVMGVGLLPPGSYHEMFSYLARLARHCRREGLPLALSVIPDKQQFGRGPSLRRFQERVGRWCADRDVLFLDALPYLEQHGGAANYFAWDPHLNEQGHRLLADFLFEQTRPLLERRLAHLP
jgi:lysophospholipase L1-like esterase